MGLDIIPCKSRNWSKSLLAVEAEQIFYSSINVKDWFPDWYEEHKEENNIGKYGITPPCNPYSDSRNIQIYNQKLIDFCAKWNVPCKKVMDEDNYPYQIDTGIESYDMYRLHSAYNETGTNSILRALNLMDLYVIFDVSQKDLEINPNYILVDWAESANKAEFIISKIRNCTRTRIGEKSISFITEQMNTIITFWKLFAKGNSFCYYRALWSE